MRPADSAFWPRLTLRHGRITIEREIALRYDHGRVLACFNLQRIMALLDHLCAFFAHQMNGAERP